MNTNKQPQYTITEQVGALLLVIFISAAFGILLGLMHGYTFPKFWKFPGFRLKPLCTKISIPPIVGMIAMGCIARNFFGDVVQPYPSYWAQWLRQCCLGLVLTRGGLNVSFSGKGLIVLFMTFIPQLCEATIIALVGLGVFKMPIELCFCLGYAQGSVAGAVLVPQLIKLNDQGWGRSKGIAGSLIASCTFDNVTCLICFGICQNLVFMYADQSRGGAQGNTGLLIGMIFVQNVVGLAIGVIVGLGAWFFKFIDKWQHVQLARAAFCLTFAIAFPVASELADFPNARFLSTLSFGYVCNRFWGDKKPLKEVAKIWFYVQPLLFGTVGAQLLFSQIRSYDVGYAILLIFCGSALRFLAVVLLTYSKKFTLKERIFMGIAWIPKTTVPATLASVIYNTAKSKGPGYDEYLQYGLYIQTTTILAIMITQPIGSWAIDQFGPKLLSNDNKETQDKESKLENIATNQVMEEKLQMHETQQKCEKIEEDINNSKQNDQKSDVLEDLKVPQEDHIHKQYITEDLEQQDDLKI